MKSTRLKFLIEDLKKDKQKLSKLISRLERLNCELKDYIGLKDFGIDMEIGVLEFYPSIREYEEGIRQTDDYIKAIQKRKENE